jgi:hypothetical protein
MIYPIETDIPLGSSHRYPFAELCIGDSFVVYTASPLAISAVRSATAYFKRHHKGTNFVCRVQRTNKQLIGIRVWRTA